MARTRTRIDEDKRRREALHERGMASIPGHKLDRWLLACQLDPCKEFDLGLLFNPTGFEIGMLLEYVCNQDNSKVDELETEIDDLKLKIDDLNDELREERDTNEKRKKAANHIEDKLYAMRKVLEGAMREFTGDDSTTSKRLAEVLDDINGKIEEALDE